MRQISVRQLRDGTAHLVEALRSGESIELTVNRHPVATIVPHKAERDPWRPAAVLRTVLAETGADRELLRDLGEARRARIDVE